MPKDKKGSTQVPRKVYNNIRSSEVGGIWLQGCHEEPEAGALATMNVAPGYFHRKIEEK